MDNKIKKTDYYKPQSFTPTTYSRFIRQYIDLNTFGYQNKTKGLNSKGHFYSTNHINNNLSDYSSKINLYTNKEIIYSNRSKIQSKQWMQQEHITSDEINLFYVSSPWSNISINGIDIDVKEDTTPLDIKKCSDFIESLFPENSIYIESSTNKKGIHCYFFSDFSDYVNKFGRMKFSTHANNLLALDSLSLSKLLKRYINNHYNVRCDGIKGYYSTYKYNKNSYGYYLERLNAGTLLKQPKPMFKVQFFKFINLNVLSPSILLELINNLYIKSDIYIEDIKHSSLLTQDSQLSLINEKSCDSSVSVFFPFFILPSSYLNYMRPKGRIEDNNKSIKTEQKPKLDTNNNDFEETDAFKRCLNSVQSIYRQLGRKPTFKEWNNYYELNKLNTGKATEERIKRFNRQVEFVEQTFNKNINNKSITYSPGIFIEQIKRDLGEEYINNYNEDNNGRKIDWMDIDIGLGYCYICLNTRIEEKEKNNQTLTIPKYSLINFYKKLKADGKTKNGCGRTKVKMIFDILLEHNYLACVDKNYTYKGNNTEGRARRYILKEKHPFHKEWVENFGEEEIKEWKVNKIDYNHINTDLEQEIIEWEVKKQKKTQKYISLQTNNCGKETIKEDLFWSG